MGALCRPIVLRRPGPSQDGRFGRGVHRPPLLPDHPDCPPGRKPSSPRRRGSSTPRLIDSITAVSGILDHPPSRTMTVEYDVRDLAALLRPRFAFRLPSPKSEGAGKTGCLLHPRSRVRFAQTKTAHEHTGQREHSGLPCAMALRLTSCSSRRTALLPPLSVRSFTSPERNASTATSEPHDFAVRFRRVRLSRHQRPSHLTARS